MKLIKLTQGMFAIVDNADYVELSKHKWHAYTYRGFWYAARRERLSKTKSVICKMHRQILGLGYGDPRQGDHINHITLDNRRNNIRICNNQQNQFNQTTRMGTSKYKGVSWYSPYKKWRTQIMKDREQKHIGYFDQEKDAAIAYNIRAKELFGEFAYLNKIGDSNG